MKVKLGSIVVAVVALVVVVAFAPSAEACEKCVSAGYNGWVKCSSGHSSGYQSCYGGFGDPCTLGDSCGSGGGIEPEHPVSIPCVMCAEERPEQGFMLRAAQAPSNAATGVVLSTGTARTGVSARAE